MADLTDAQMDAYEAQPPNYDEAASELSLLNEIVNRAYLFINDPQYFVPIVRELIQQTVNALGDEDVVIPNLTQEACRVINESESPTITLDANKLHLAAYAPETHEIQFNAAWIGYLSSLKKTGCREFYIGASVAVAKYLHEFANSLTKQILYIEKEVHQRPTVKKNGRWELSSSKMCRARRRPGKATWDMPWRN